MLNSNIRALLAARHTKPHTTQQAIVNEESTGALPDSIDELGRWMSANREKLAIGVGGGVSREAMTHIEKLASWLGCEVVGSRPAVDAGLIPPDRMVGQTGIHIAPKNYVAFGISGDRLHTVGLAPHTRIIAINSDPEAPLSRLALRSFCCDAERVAEELLKKNECVIR